MCKMEGILKKPYPGQFVEVLPWAASLSPTTAYYQAPVAHVSIAHCTTHEYCPHVLEG